MSPSLMLSRRRTAVAAKVSNVNALGFANVFWINSGERRMYIRVPKTLMVYIGRLILRLENGSAHIKTGKRLEMHERLNSWL